MFLHVTRVEYLRDYVLRVTFNDGRVGEADLASALSGPVFAPLKDKALFAQAAIDPELETVAWPNGADLAPEFLYFKAFRDDPALARQFEEWGYLPAGLAADAV